MALMFKFISGKYKGGEFPLDKDVIVIGRHSDLEMVLSEDMVSRRHAKITISGNDVILEDMGSTNGTFVNGSRIKKIKLKLNDRILIGTSIAKFIDSDDTGQNMEDAAKIGTNAVSGSIEDIPIPEVLQLLATSKKTGVLRVTSGSVSAEIQLVQGIFKDVTMIGSNADPKKILIKLIKLDSGFFEFEQKDPSNFGNRLNISLDAFLLEAAKYEDEVGLDDLDFELDDDNDLILDDFDEVSEVSVNIDDIEDDVLDFDDFDNGNIETASDDDIFSLDDLDDDDDDFALDDLAEEPKRKTSKPKDDAFNLDDLDDDDFALDDLDDEPKRETPKPKDDDFNLDDLDDDDDFALDDFEDKSKKETPKTKNSDFNLDDLDDDDDFALDDLDDEPEKKTKIKNDDFNLDDLDSDDDFVLDDLDNKPKQKESEDFKSENDDFNLDDLDNDDDFTLDGLGHNKEVSDISNNSNDPEDDFNLNDLDTHSDQDSPQVDSKPEINLEELKEKFPDDDEYVIPLPLFSPLDELNKNELKVLQLVHNFSSISEIIENTELSKEETYAILDKLAEEDYIEQ